MNVTEEEIGNVKHLNRSGHVNHSKLKIQMFHIKANEVCCLQAGKQIALARMHRNQCPRFLPNPPPSKGHYRTVTLVNQSINFVTLVSQPLLPTNTTSFKVIRSTATSLYHLCFMIINIAIEKGWAGRKTIRAGKPRKNRQAGTNK